MLKYLVCFFIYLRAAEAFTRCRAFCRCRGAKKLFPAQASYYYLVNKFCEDELRARSESMAQYR